MTGLQEIPLSKIQPHPDNPRRFANGGETPKIDELAQSILAVGLLEPILLRQLNGGFQIIAGERRWRACEVAGLERIPAIVKDLDDKAALEVMITENLQREDLGVLEEARGVKALVSKADWTTKDVADRLGKSLHWVAQRARLADLHPEIAKKVEDPKCPMSSWTVQELLELARLEPDVQLEVCKHNHWFENKTWNDQVFRIIKDLLRNLSGAPWKLGDAALYPEAGSCLDCRKRSSCHPGLFEDEGDGSKPSKKERCLDPKCWGEKMRRFKDGREAELRAEHPKLIRVSGEGAYDRQDGVISHWGYQPAKKNEPGALPALVVAGKGEGSLRWVKVNRDTNPARSRPKTADGKVIPKTMKERRADLDRRRIAKAAEILKEHLPKQEPPSATVLLQVAAVFGAGWSCDHRNNGLHIPDGMKKIDDRHGPWWLLAKLSHDDGDGGSLTRDLLWARIREVFRKRLEYWSGCDIRELNEEIQFVSNIAGLHFPGIQIEAAKAIPEPKSWARLREDGTSKGTKPGKPDPKKGKRAAREKIFEGDSHPKPLIYELNEHGVFHKPEVITINVPAKLKADVKVTLACGEDLLWRYGYEVRCNWGDEAFAFSGLPSTKSTTWDSREGAFEACCHFCARNLREQLTKQHTSLCTQLTNLLKAKARSLYQGRRPKDTGA